MRIRLIKLAAFCAVILCLGNAPRAAVATGTQTPAPLFEFHSGFWINLHHFLYRQGQLAGTQKGPHAVTLTLADNEELKTLSPAEREAWDSAVSYYSNEIVKRDLLFDDGLIAIKDQLEDAETSPDLASAAIPVALKTVLLKAAPIYRKHFWPRHDAENRQWIGRLKPLVAQYGSTLEAKMVAIDEEPWPQFPVRVDAVTYANWAGAYTTIQPTRPTISTSDPANQGPAALEIVFHETSHGMMDKVMDAFSAAETRLNADRPGAAFHSGSVWHAVLFYTAGQLVADQIPNYVPYADKNGLWLRAWLDPDKALIEKDWKPHMQGSVGLQQAVTKLVIDLAAVPKEKH